MHSGRLTRVAIWRRYTGGRTALGQIRLCNLRSRREPGSFELSISLNRSSYSSASKRVISPRVTRTSEVSDMLEEFSRESLRLLIILRISTTSMRLKRIIRSVPMENQDIANIHASGGIFIPFCPNNSSDPCAARDLVAGVLPISRKFSWRHNVGASHRDMRR